MGYTIRDYINDEINSDLRELEKEYNIEIIDLDESNDMWIEVWKNKKQVNGIWIEINFDTTLSHIKDYIRKEIEIFMLECVGCGEWFDNYIDDEVDLDLTNDEYYHSLECLEKHEPQLWDRYCKALGD